MKPLVTLFAALCVASASATGQPASPAPGVVTPMPPEGLSVGPATKAPPAEEAGSGMEAAAAELLKAFQGGATNNPLAKLGGQPVVDFRELRALLPEEMSGLRRTEARGEKAGFLGAQIAVAEGDYGGPEGPRLEVKITDLGGMGPLGTLAGMGWMATEIDREGDQGYERTTMFQGRKGFEKYDKRSRSGSTTVTVRNRFLVEIQGFDIEPGQMSSAIDSINLSGLDQIVTPAVGP